MNELNELQDQAYENSLIYKEKTKKIHDSKIKNRVFNVGDRVLLFNSRLNIFSGKLPDRPDHSPLLKFFLMVPSSYLKLIDQTSRGMVIDLNITMEETYHLWLSQISKPSPLTTKFRVESVS
ncbi:hypothetical protein Tco_0640340 [Tanacetum coccineum]